MPECLSEACLSQACEALAQAKRTLTERGDVMGTPASWAAVEALNAAEALLQAEQIPEANCRQEQLFTAISFARSAVIASRYAAGERVTPPGTASGEPTVAERSPALRPDGRKRALAGVVGCPESGRPLRHRPPRTEHR